MKHLLWPTTLVLLLFSCTSGKNDTPVNPNVAPSIVNQPASLTVNEGQTASFTVSATGFPAPIYQWRKNGTDIPGAVATSYTTPVTTASDNGAVFTVLVTNSVNAVTSGPATLTVNQRPAITTPPASRTVTEGQAATFSVVATGFPTPTYQWRKNGTPITGAVAATYTTPATTLSDNGAQFTVAVANVVDTVFSPAVTLTVQPAILPPTITTQPLGQTVDIGSPVTFHVAASGTEPFSYQWKKDGASLPGAISQDYTIPSAQTVHSGSYTVVVTNAADSVTSNAAVLAVRILPPVITTHPQSQTVDAGATVAFHVVASGTAPFTYQWRRNGTSIAGATAQDYVITNVQAAHAGSYTVVVTNAADSATSSAAVLTVNTATGPTITSHPQSLTVNLGDPASFSVEASGTTPFTYQWKRNGSNINGAIFSTYSIPSAQTGHAGTYTVVVTNSVNSATSNPAVLTVQEAAVGPTITSQPQSQTVAVGDTAQFSVVATGTEPLSYQWKKGGVNIGGAMGQSYSISNVQTTHAGSYTVVVTNGVNSATSDPAVLTVQPAVSTLTGFSPSGGPVGTSVTITGTNLTGATAVRFNGTSAPGFTVDSATQIRATVPAGASTGPLSVVTPLNTATSSASFTVGSSSLDLWIQNVYINQTAQKLDGSVPLIKNRDGLLRAFALANQANTAQPKVKVQIFSGATEVWSETITPGGSSVPLTVDESSLAKSWNATIPGTHLAPGNTILVTVDPANEIAESNDSNNTWPSSGGAGALNAVVLPVLRMTVVPLFVRGAHSRVLTDGLDAYLDMIPRVLPVHQITSTLHAEYSSSVIPTCSGSATWSTLLGEVRVLWNDEGKVGNYYGLLKFDDSGYCIRGMGYSGGYPVSIGWDYNVVSAGSVSGNASETIAHELGHNFGYRHTACSGEDNPDPGYPYAGGGIGIWGYDLFASVLRSPSTYKDLMTYCDPYWISDYSYKKMLQWRQTNASLESAEPVTKEPCLVVWGHTDGERLVLEPALTMDSVVSLPEPGDFTLAGLDAAGREIFSIPFATTPIADAQDPKAGSFFFVLPHRVLDVQNLAELRVTDALQRTVRSVARSTQTPEALLSPSGLASRLDAGTASLRWNHQIYPLVLVRDPASRQIVAILRNGEGDVPTRSTELDVTFSDGVRSSTVKVPVQE